MTPKDLVNAINCKHFINIYDLKRSLGSNIKDIVEISCKWFGKKFSLSTYKICLKDGGYAFAKCISSNFDKWTAETVGYMVASQDCFEFSKKSSKFIIQKIKTFFSWN